MITLCGGMTRISAPLEPVFGLVTGFVVISELVVGNDSIFGLVVELVTDFVVIGELVIGNDSVFEPLVVLDVWLDAWLDVVVPAPLLATIFLNGSPKLCE